MISRFGLFAILASFVLLASAYSVIIPLGEAPDEVPHFAYVQYLILHHQLPPPEGAVSGESHQPPLYYVLGALATAWIPQSGFRVIANPDFALDNVNTPNLLVHDLREAFPYHDDALAWHLVRLMSIAMGVVTVWATWQIARQAFPGEPWVALGAASFVAFLPGFVFISAVVNNDNLIMMLSSLAILQIIRMARRSYQARDSVVLGVLLGLAALAKLSGFVVWTFAALVLGVQAYRIKTRGIAAVRLALGFGIAAAIIAPWLVHNLVEYNDPLGWSLILSTTPIRESPMTLNDWIGTGVGLYTSFWGRFGGALQIHMPAMVYAALGLIGVFSLGGWVFTWRRWRIEPNSKQVAIYFVLFWLIMLAAYVRWVLTVLGADQARQLFPGLPLVAVVLAGGIVQIAASRSRVALWFLAASLVSLNVAVLFYLNSIYVFARPV